MTLAGALTLALLAASVSVGTVLFVVDIRSHRLPNRLVFALYPLGLGVAVCQSVLRGAVWPVVCALLSAVALFAAYYLLRSFGGGMGGGDVKLAGAVGLVTGAAGWQEPALATAAAFVLGGLAALGLVLARRATRSTRIAFGPFMLIGASLVVGVALCAGRLAVNPTGPA